MTREEAIAIIENEKECVNRANKNDYCNRDCYNCELVKTDTEILTALDMAIKALEQEPCEDCIRRSDVGLTDFEIVMCDGDYKEALKMLSDKIEKAPSVTPQPKTGHWINKSHTSGCGVTFVESECTCCGKKTPFNCDEFLYRYCPNCGAKMVEPHESEVEECR